MNFANNPNVEPKTYPELDNFENISEKQHLSDDDEFPDLTKFLDNFVDKAEQSSMGVSETWQRVLEMLTIGVLMMYGQDFTSTAWTWWPWIICVGFIEIIMSGTDVDEDVLEDLEVNALPTGNQKSSVGTVHSKTKAAAMIGGKRMRLRRGVTVDSGAANNVMPRRMVRDKSKIRSSPASRRGVYYIAANNGRIPNEGEVDFEFVTEHGKPEFLVMQIAEVNKALGSVSYMVDRGYKVVFDKDKDTDVDLSMMIHKETGQATRFRRDRQVWVLDAYCQDGCIVSNAPAEAPFPRHP